jgi:hypothetical protein
MQQFTERQGKLLSRSKLLEDGGWLEDEKAPHHDFSTAPFEALKTKPYDATHEELYRQAEAGLEQLDTALAGLERTIGARQSALFTQEKEKVDRLKNDLQAVVISWKSVASATELRDQYSAAESLQTELTPVSGKYAQLDAGAYTKTAHEQGSQDVEILLTRFRKINEALYQKPIIAYSIDDGDDDIGYSFTKQRDALDAALKTDQFVVASQEVEHETFFIIDVIFRAQKFNETAGFGDLKNYDWRFFYEVKIRNGGVELKDKYRQQMEIKRSRSYNSKQEEKDQLATFEQQFADDCGKLVTQIQTSFAEVKKAKLDK